MRPRMTQFNPRRARKPGGYDMTVFGFISGFSSLVSRRIEQTRAGRSKDYSRGLFAGTVLFSWNIVPDGSRFKPTERRRSGYGEAVRPAAKTPPNFASLSGRWLLQSIPSPECNARCSRGVDAH